MIEKEKEKPDYFESYLLKLLTSIFKEVGMAGFISIFVIVIFFFVATPEQKSEFVDRFILLKNTSQDPIPFYFIVILLVIGLISSNYFGYMERVRLKKEINRISKEKTDLQNKFLGNNLESSS